MVHHSGKPAVIPAPSESGESASPSTVPTASGPAANAPRPQLTRGLGGLSAAALLTGTVIGTGIFLVPSTIARETGSVGGVFFIWIFGGLLSLAGALSYAELGAAIPEAGGEYVFLRRAYGPFWGFLYGWQQVVIGKTGSMASMAMGFAVFLSFFLAGLDRELLQADIPFWGTTGFSGLQAVALAGIAVLTAINYFGLILGAGVQTFLTILKIGAILGLTAVALTFGEGSWSHFGGTGEPLSSPPRGLVGIAAALSAVLWAYDGWNNLTMVSSEVRQPQKMIPRVLIFGTGGVMLVYLLANLAYLYVLPLPAVAGSQRVAQDVASSIFGSVGGSVITLAALISTLAALNGAILTGARVSYAMARDGLFFRRMADVHPSHRTPAHALLLQAFVACLLILIMGGDRGAFDRLFSFAIFGMWVFYGLTALAVIVLRYREPDLPRAYRTLGYPWVPLVFTLVSAGFCLSMLYNQPRETTLGLVLLAAGIPFFLHWRKLAET